MNTTLLLRRFGPVAVALAAMPACNLICPYNADQVFETQIRAECHFYFACCTAGELDVLDDVSGFPDLSQFKDEQNCVQERLEEGSGINLFARAITEAERAGRFQYDAAIATTCLQARNDAMNNCDADFILGDAGPLEEADECSGVPGTGLVKAFDPCFFDFECAAVNSVCLPPSVQETPDLCSVDDDCRGSDICDDGICTPDLGVIEIHDDRICIPPLNEGDDCSPDPDLPFLPPVCEKDTICITDPGNGDQTCEFPRPEGDECLLDRDCEKTLYCDQSNGSPGECTVLKGEGDECLASSECELGLFCDGSRNNPSCEAPLPVDVFICNGIQGAEDPDYPVATE